MNLKLADLGLSALTLFPSWAGAFTVQTASTPSGHEFLTVCAAQGGCSIDQVDTDFGADKPYFWGPFSSDPRSTFEADWRHYSCVGCERFGAGSPLVWSTVIGARWVDLRGFLLSEPRGSRPQPLLNSHADAAAPLEPLQCWQAVTQLDDSVQHDHFLRKREEDPTIKNVSDTVAAIVARFKFLFKEAVTKGRAKRDDDPLAKVLVVDGGDKQVRFKVNEAYFLLGRAMHLLQDSFSSEHVVRELVRTDLKKISRTARIKRIKTQVCTPNAHKHNPRDGMSRHLGEACSSIGEPRQLHGDVVFSRNFGHDLKETAQLAVVASRELFILFEEILSRPTTATVNPDAEGAAFAAKWFPAIPGKEAPEAESAYAKQKECFASDSFSCEVKKGNLVGAYFNGCLGQMVSAGSFPVSTGAPSTGGSPVTEEYQVGSQKVTVRLPGYNAKLPDWLTGSAPVECAIVPLDILDENECPGAPECYGTSKWKTLFRLQCQLVGSPVPGFWDTVKGGWKLFLESPIRGFSGFGDVKTGNDWCTSGWDLFLEDNVTFFAAVRTALEKGEDLSGWQYAGTCAKDIGIGMASNFCQAIGSAVDLLTVGARHAVKNLACANFAVAFLRAPNPVNALAYMACGISFWIPTVIEPAWKCLKKIFDSNSLSQAVKAKVWFEIRKILCQFLGGLVADLLAGIPPKVTRLVFLRTKLLKAFESVNDLVSLGKKFGLDKTPQAIFDNLFGGGSAFQDSVNSLNECAFFR